MVKIARTKNAVRNIIFGVLYKFINIILPFFSRTAILYVLGTEYLGLSSLFSSILSFLSLAELGVGGAMVYSMYKPIAQNDKKTIKGLLNLYKKFYRIIGTVFLSLGMCLMPFIRILIKGDIPTDINIYLLFFLYLINAVLSYWLFAYKVALLQAYQRNDIDSKIGMFITPLSYIIMTGCMLITKSYYGYIIWLPIFTICTNIIRSISADRLFPDLKPEGDISKDLKKSITKKVSALIGTKLNTVVLHAADNIVMSKFLGLTVVAIYGNYYYIMTSIMGFLSICYSSMTAGLGNSLAMESTEKNYKDLMKFSFINSWLVSWCVVCLITLYQPFMLIWVGEKLMFSFTIVLELGIYFYVYMIRKIPVVYKDAAGIWWEDRYRPYVCMIINVVLNVYLVQMLGISGIILSTVFSLFISIPWENYTIFKYIFKCSSKEYYLKMTYYAITMAVGGMITYFVCSLLPYGIMWFLVKGIVCIILPNIVFIVLNHNREEFHDSLLFIQRIIKRK